MNGKIIHMDKIVEDLLKRKYPGVIIIRREESAPFISYKDSSEETKKEILCYLDELEAKSEGEIKALVEMVEHAHLVLAQYKESQYFFNQENAKADCEHFAKAYYWTIEEFIALSFGLDPRIVSWDKMKSFTKVSTTAKEYEDIRDLALRSLRYGELKAEDKPSVYIGWCKHNKKTFDRALEELVVQNHGSIADFRSAFEMSLQTIALQKEDINKLQGLLQDKDNKIASLESKRKGNEGGRPSNDWPEFHAEIFRRYQSKVLPIQKVLIPEMQTWCEEKWGKEVAESTARAQVKHYYDRSGNAETN